MNHSLKHKTSSVTSSSSSYALPSCLPLGTMARFVHSRTADVIVGRVMETGDGYALVRQVNEHGLPLLTGPAPINDSKYIIKEIYD